MYVIESQLPLPTKRRLEYVDAVRGIACLWVLMHHTFQGSQIPDGRWHYPALLLKEFSYIGWLGVSVFLVLSGFCLYYPIVARHNLATYRLNVRDFFKRRIRRIIPPYYAALILLTLFEIFAYRYRYKHWDFRQGLHSNLDIVLHLLMLHNLFGSTIASVSAAFWSLALESQLYVVFPLLIFLFRRFGIKASLLITLIIAIIWQSMCFRYLHLGFSREWTPLLATRYHALPGRCFEFAAGMAAAHFAARPRPGQTKWALRIILFLTPPALFFVLCIARFGPVIDQVWGTIFAALLVALFSVQDRWFQQNRILKWFVWLGTISYSVYLVHQPLIYYFNPEYLQRKVSILGTYEVGLLRLPVLILIGYVFHLVFERPFMPGRPKTERQAEKAAILSPAP